MTQPKKASEAREEEERLIQELADVIGSFEIVRVDPVGDIPPTGIHTEKSVTIEGNVVSVHVDCRDKSKHHQYKPETGIFKNFDVEIRGKDGSVKISGRKNGGKTTICTIEVRSNMKNPGMYGTMIKLYEADVDGNVKDYHEHNDGLDETALTGAIRKLSQFNNARVRKAPSRREERAEIQEAIARMVSSTLA